ncbi:hypothetical protein PSACC_00147 [Paramicrosporidium saccamoebae]|uniref:Ankyrin repeat-containing protein n=1 Tax=Paramicrosporidium saccamoebae TaxID=1246581 RepID=A0A2H9TQL3_9FUNG|nr:hypothetical protein PSACC_00147 [Paramicrosporidium saccamoebae]
MGKQTRILEWLEEQYKCLRESFFVRCACDAGRFSVLKWAFERRDYYALPMSAFSELDILNCFMHAAMYKRREDMDWILESFGKNALLSVSDIYQQVDYSQEETYLEALGWMALKPGNTVEVNPRMMEDAAKVGHVRVFQWLCKQGQTPTLNVAKIAAKHGKIGILKAIHAEDSALVCSVEVANEAAKSQSVWRYDILEWMWEACTILPTEPEEDSHLQNWVADKSSC